MLLIVISEGRAYATESLKTRYAVIVYSGREQLEEFTENIYLGSFSYLLRRRSPLTLKDEVSEKFDIVIERVMEILEMFPKRMSIKVVLHNDQEGVNAAYRNIYGISTEFIAFYSPKTRELHLSLNDLNLHVLAHESAHAVIDHYFGVAPPTKIHEVLAQYVEEHID
ncbi:MAG: hypothetical protein D6726_05095 [Nitrospirae bacterium]|nr:MAG: hypothetical protein D6726_05095 [Nitrospirota bacterium]